jgi:hypothetical protein
MNTQPASRPSRSLPVFACTSHTLNSTFRYRAAAVRIGLPWVILITLANLAVGLATGAMGRPLDPANMSPQAVAGEVLLFAVSIIGASSMATNWHLYILKDQQPASLAEVLRLDPPVWRYATFTLLNLLIVLVPAGLLLAFNMALLPAIPVALLAVFIAAIFLLRLSLVLPAIALGRRDFGYGAALAATREQMAPLAGLLLVNVALVLSIMLGFGLLLMLVAALPAPVALMLAALVSIAANIVLAIYSVSLLSSLYGFYVEERDFRP